MNGVLVFDLFLCVKMKTLPHSSLFKNIPPVISFGNRLQRQDIHSFHRGLYGMLLREEMKRLQTISFVLLCLVMMHSAGWLLSKLA
jgi:hypothetical protein